MGGSGNNVFFMIKCQCFFYNFQILNNMGWIRIRLRMLCECFVCECYSSVVLVLCGCCVTVMWALCELWVSGVSNVCECGVWVWCVNVVYECGVWVWCTSVVCKCGVWCVWVWCGVWVWYVSVVCECGVWVWCVSVVCECGVWVWCVSLVLSLFISGEKYLDPDPTNKSNWISIQIRHTHLI